MTKLRYFLNLNTFYKVCLLFFVFFHMAFPSSASEDECLPEALHLYHAGKFDDIFQIALEEEDGVANHICANICFKELGGEYYSLKNAALHFYIAALQGHMDSIGYLSEKIGHHKIHREEAMETLVFHWVSQKQKSILKKKEQQHINPTDIVNYLVFFHGRKINLTSSHKLTYFFERFTIALLKPYQYSKFYSSPSEIKDCEVSQDASASSSSSSSSSSFSEPQNADEKKSFIEKLSLRMKIKTKPYSPSEERSIAMSAGPVYSDHQNHSRSYVLDRAFFPKPQEEEALFLLEKISAFYRRILDKEHMILPDRASILSQRSHNDAPWILAKLRFIKALHEVNQKDVPVWIDTAIESIRTMHPIAPGLRESINSPGMPDPFPQKGSILDGKKIESIRKTLFQQEQDVFFRLPLSQDDYLVTSFKKHFDEQVFDLSKTNALEPGTETLLEAPILLFFCKKMTVTNLSACAEHVKCLHNILRYSFHLEELSLSYSSDYADDKHAPSEQQQSIEKILEAFKYNNIKIKEATGYPAI